jgi:dUTP pyrophosphatase
MRPTERVEVKVVRARPESSDLPLPRYQTELSAGMDLLADIPASRLIPPLGRAAIPTGLCLEIPPGYEGQIRPRSGLALKNGITCLNAPGTVDADYRGEVQVILANVSNEPFTVHRGDRIAQLVIAPVTRAQLALVPALSPTTRGAGGFGSTGGLARNG